MSEHDSSFLSRWSRRKAQGRSGVPASTEAAPPPAPARDAAATLTPAALPATAAVQAAPPQAPIPQAGAVPPAPTLADVAALSAQSDYTRFVARGVAPEVKNAALKKLFTDPHFNLMDGLDTYIDDYGKPDPLPAGMLRQMVQSQLLGLFNDDKEDDIAAASPTTPDAALPAQPCSAAAHAAPPDLAQDDALRAQPALAPAAEGGACPTGPHG